MTQIVPDKLGVLGRRLILASAGSGKTYRLSSHLIGLLAIDVAPQEILASTFTRKAAGEIMGRILQRLAGAAADPAQAEKLAQSMPSGVPRDRLSGEACARLLARTVLHLHRLQVLTIDAFFYRVARVFALELGLPQSWTLAHDPDRDRLRSRAVETTLREMDPKVLSELARGAGRGPADRAVHRLLLDGVGELHEIFRSLDPQVKDPWGTGGKREIAADGDLGRIQGLIARFENAELPATKTGQVDGRWRKARSEAIADLRSGNWSRFLATGMARAILCRDGIYRGKPVPQAMHAILSPLIDLARASFLAEHDRRLAALGRFLPEYDRRIQRIEREESLYHFEDLTHAVSRLGQAARADEIAYRLDQRVRHLLLDEFQDTSNAQWSALAPLADDILSGREPDRTLFVVADPKQSIYGWRGGEPRIIDRLQEEYGLEAEMVSESWRSSSVVLNAVNRVFGEIEDNDVLSEEKEAVTRWALGFREHYPARDLEGYVRLEVGPNEEEGAGRNFRPTLLSHAAGEVARLHREAPTATIGVLTRTNQSAAYVFAHLSQAGIDASEEGGVPVADSAPVLAILALLRMADHPLDTISRYLVKSTPVGSLLGLSPEEWMDEEAVARAGLQVRGRLLSDGYGRLVSEWVAALAREVGGRDKRRLRQLSELAYRWDERATSRPSDFVRVAEAARLEDPASAFIRVMTLHKAKGLEFDAVVLPDLNGRAIVGGRSSPYMAFREDGAGLVQRVLPRIRQELVPAFPELTKAAAQEREGELRDGLSSLYVGLTRARHAAYIYVSPDSRRGSKVVNPAHVLRQALAPGVAANVGSVLFSDGRPDWWRTGGHGARAAHEVTKPSSHAQRPTGLKLAPSPRRRMVPHRAPSDLGIGGRIRIERLLRPEARGARDRGTVIHQWLSQIEWIEEGVPSDETLLGAAAGLASRADGLDALLEGFHEWIGDPAIRGLLSQDSFPLGTRVEMELPFIARDDSGLIEGRADRVLYIPDGAKPRLTIVDWKSEFVDASDDDAVTSVVERHRPQVEAYMRALAVTEGIPADRVDGLLAFVTAGVVKRVSPTP